MRFDAPTLAPLRAHLMKRGLKLATLLSEVLAGKGKERELAALAPGRPGLRPEERVRIALDQVETRRKLIDADDDAFGRCDVCSDDLGLPALTDVPWADRCQKHAPE